MDTAGANSGDPFKPAVKIKPLPHVRYTSFLSSTTTQKRVKRGAPGGPHDSNDTGLFYHVEGVTRWPTYPVLLLLSYSERSTCRTMTEH